jgi:hypothetical protein
MASHPPKEAIFAPDTSLSGEEAIFAPDTSLSGEVDLFGAPPVLQVQGREQSQSFCAQVLIVRCRNYVMRGLTLHTLLCSERGLDYKDIDRGIEPLWECTMHPQAFVVFISLCGVGGGVPLNIA